ncbi:hypothetical protein NLG97_g6535 [Lecanicillium saksenae]|uniref:Uncharacterized protein n=1 Tax=Lecanicillium saksenae TaxID=468837 RepID=A0ACC1QQZ8_9HYPO|nr:hypothetical protein NLG97_g6535 [Lecanicillium saksenae]
MASQVRRPVRLDARDRAVVFCHACAFEWFREEGGLICPSCESEITEVVSMDNDPRPPLPRETIEYQHEDEDEYDDDDDDDEEEEDEDEPVQMAEIVGHMQDDEEGDSDPEEADIEDHADPNGFGYDQDTQAGEGADHYDSDPRRSVERFLNVVSTIGMPFSSAEANRQFMRQVTRAATHQQGHVEWANGNSQGSVTFFASNGPQGVGEHAQPSLQDFSTMFTGAFRGFGVQLTGEALEAAAEQDGRAEIPNLAENIGNIISLINGGIHGDGVYTQEALDRIVSNLMEANPQSNAAPPASDQALASLPRRTLDEDLRSEDGNTECSICIDGMKEGETILSLPCRHSFHDECVVMWLKEHNTCPICRAPMEGRAGGRSNANHASSSRQNEQQQPHAQTSTETPGDDAPLPSAGSSSSLDAEQMQIPQASGSSRPPNQGQTRINQAMRYLSSQQREQDRSRGASTPFSFDTSRLQRRSSMSPTSPRVAVGEGDRRMRERSPSQNSRRTGSTADDQSSNSGNGGMGWLRGRYVE